MGRTVPHCVVLGGKSVRMGQRGGIGPAACGSGIVGAVHICGGQGGESATCPDAHLQECFGVGMLLYHVYEWIELLRHAVCKCIPFFGGPCCSTHSKQVTNIGRLQYLPQYFQIVRGASAIRSGVLTLPLMLVQTVTSFTSGIIQSKTGDYWWNLVVGYTIWTIGLGLISSITSTTSIAKLSGYQIIVGIGAGQTFQTSLVAIQAGVERKDMATATGLRNFLRQLGGTIALAACNSIVNNCVRRNLSGVLPGTAYKAILEDPTRATSLGLSASELSAVTDAYGECRFGGMYMNMGKVMLTGRAAT